MDGLGADGLDPAPCTMKESKYMLPTVFGDRSQSGLQILVWSVDVVQGVVATTLKEKTVG